MNDLTRPPAVPGASGSRTGEANFSLDELFYSRTDPRGVIAAGNEVFRRVAGFEWDELLGAPHKIVRHPDTPRAIFRVLWDALGKGNPMGAYVMNRTKQGGWYWVFAVVMPIKGGYLSVRLKPSTTLSATMQEMYRKASARERAEGLDPEASASLMREEARKAGFSSYTSLMAHALAHELSERDRRLQRKPEARTRVLGDLNRMMEEVSREQHGLLRSFDSLQSVPNNMRIVASRLEPSGGPVSAISENYKASSVVISERLRSFVAGRDNLCDTMSREVSRALFELGCSRLLAEMNETFQHAPPIAQIDHEGERVLLSELETKAGEDARRAMQSAADIAGRLTRQSRDIRRQMLGLDTIRVLGRVECGRMRDNGGSLSATIDQLDSFHADIKGRLEAITRLSEEVEASMTQYLRRDEAA